MANTPPAVKQLGERALAAVMFTDVVNYSGQVTSDEEATLVAVNRDFATMAAILERYKGNLLKTMGDGMLAHFYSVVNAVRCAMEIQAAIAAATQAQQNKHALQHRISIHVGDVYITDNDVFGSGVIIAARLQPLAKPGGICISQTVFDLVKHRLSLHVNYLGSVELKHISDAVPAYQVLGDKSQAEAKHSPASSPSSPTTTRPSTTPAPAPASAPARTPMNTKAPALAVELTPTAQSRRRAPTPRGSGDDPHPFCLVLLADFSGRESRSLVEPLATRAPLPVNCDNLEKVFARLQVRLRLPVRHQPGESLEMGFRSLEQMHPDQLLANIPALAKLNLLRTGLSHSNTAAATSAKLAELLHELNPDTPPPPAIETDAATVTRLLGQSPSVAPTRPAAGAKPVDTVQSYIQRLVGGSSVPTQSPQSMASLVRLDSELTEQLRAILHHPDFHACESAWRGAEFLVRHFGSEENLQLLLVDVSKTELLADLQGNGDIEKSGLARMLADQPCAAILGDYFFGGQDEDVELLGRLAQVAQWADTNFIGGANPELAGCESFARQPDSTAWHLELVKKTQEAWQALRRQPAAAHAALALPRFLLRQPYGKWSDPIETFPFEELSESLPHESFLWGNGSLACGYVLATDFVNSGWDTPLSGGEIEDLPVHCALRDGTRVMKPCAEAWLSDRAVAVLEDKGFIAVQSIKNRDSVRLAKMRSLAHPYKPLQLKAPA